MQLTTVLTTEQAHVLLLLQDETRRTSRAPTLRQVASALDLSLVKVKTTMRKLRQERFAMRRGGGLDVLRPVALEYVAGRGVVVDEQGQIVAEYEG